MKVKLLGKISGKFNGYDYFKLLVGREVKSNTENNIVADGYAIYNPVKDSKSVYIKTTREVFEQLNVGSELDTDYMFYNSRGTLVDC